MNKGISAVAPTVPLTRVKVKIDERHIAAGIPNNCRHCPIAMALTEIVWPSISVEVTGIFYKFANGKWFNALPLSAFIFVSIFDFQGESPYPVSPFSFDLDIPTDFLRK